MKAYAVNTTLPEFWDVIVWAKNASKAKSEVLGCDSVCGWDYIDLRAKRVKWADGLDSIDDWSFFKERIKHEDLSMGECYGDGLLTEADFSRIQKYNSYEELSDAWEQGKFKTIDELENEA